MDPQSPQQHDHVVRFRDSFSAGFGFGAGLTLGAIVVGFLPWLAVALIAGASSTF